MCIPLAPPTHKIIFYFVRNLSGKALNYKINVDSNPLDLLSTNDILYVHSISKQKLIGNRLNEEKKTWFTSWKYELRVWRENHSFIYYI